MLIGEHIARTGAAGFVEVYDTWERVTLYGCLDAPSYMPNGGAIYVEDEYGAGLVCAAPIIERL